MQIPVGRGSVLRRRRCDMLCTSGLWMTSRLAVVGRMALAALRHRGGVCLRLPCFRFSLGLLVPLLGHPTYLSAELGLPRIRDSSFRHLRA